MVPAVVAAVEQVDVTKVSMHMAMVGAVVVPAEYARLQRGQVEKEVESPPACTSSPRARPSSMLRSSVEMAAMVELEETEEKVSPVRWGDRVEMDSAPLLAATVGMERRVVIPVPEAEGRAGIQPPM